MPTRSESSKKTAERLKMEDPDYYSRIGKRGNEARSKKYYHFKALQEQDPEKLKEIASKAGKKSKRGKRNV